MGQRHNRRRTRGTRSRKRASPNFHSTLPPSTTILDTSVNNHRTSINLSPNNFATHAWTFTPVPSTKQFQWLNWYIGCQNPEHKLLQDVVMIEADQYRLFGGEPGDDVSLCYRMLEYFGGLDYIES